MSIYDQLCSELASIDVAVAHARLQVVRPQPDRPSFNKSAAAHPKYPAAVCGTEGDDGHFVAKRFCRGTICSSPAARRIRGVGRRAKRRTKYLLLVSYNGSLSALHQKPKRRFIIIDAVIIRIGPDGQTYAGNTALCITAARLLAFESIGD